MYNMLGLPVTQETLNYQAPQAVLALHAAFEKIEIIATWLANHPSGQTDPLVTDFGYTVDEAYILRFYFETFDAVREANLTTFDIGRKMTGLE
jgi:hypothetical protein